MPRKAVEKNKVDANILDEPGKKSFGRTQGVNERIEESLSMKYLFRFNTIKCKPEFAVIGGEDGFKPIDKYTLNSFWRQMDSAGFKTNPGTLKDIFESEFANRVNPVKEYFKIIVPWDGITDHIQQLAETVTVKNPDKWALYLKKWMVGCVANVFVDEKCMNHTCLVLSGNKQGQYKTSWLDNLCPKQLAPYLFTGKIDPNSKDILTLIAEFFLVNIDDQLRTLHAQDENQLKTLITIPRVKYRRPYDPYITEYPHLCSFMASVNLNDFLTDPSGSRRFLPFEVLEIDINKAQALSMDLPWAQAYDLFKKRAFTYWFTQDDVIELEKSNAMFQVISLEEDLLLQFYSKPDSRDLATDHLPLGILITHISELTKQKLNQKRMSAALHKHGFENWQRTKAGEKKWVWSVSEKSGPQLTEQFKAAEKVEVF